MSRSQAVLRISVLLALAFHIPALSAQSSAGTDKIVTAKQVMRELYPELKGRDLQVVIRDWSSLDSTRAPTNFGLYIFEAVNAIAESITEKCPPFLLEPINNRATITTQCPEFLISVEFSFPVEGDDRIFSIHASRDVVNVDKVLKIDQLVDAHPEWSDRDVEDALRRAGVHFGPWAKDEFIHSLPLPVFKSILGDVHVESVNFFMRDKQ